MVQEHHITFGPFRLDITHGGRLWRGANVIALRPRSLAVLRYLAAHPGRLVTKAELQQQVWAGTHVSDTVLRVCVQEIRAALGDIAAVAQYIETVRPQGYRFLVPGDGTAPSSAPSGSLVIGRQREVEVLEGWFQRAAHGDRQLVFVSGEAGIGKTTVLDLVLARLAADTAVRIGRGQCVESYGVGEPYLPVLEALGQLSRGPAAPALRAVLQQEAPMWLVQLPSLVHAADLAQVQRQVQGATQARMLRELADACAALTAAIPLVLVLEDLHWSDSATVECLAALAQRREPARLLVLGTYRPVEALLRGHPVRGLVQELLGRGACAELRLDPLPAADVAAYVAGRLGGPVAASLAAVVHERTEGNALFMVNLLEHLVRQGLVVRQGGQWTLRGGTEAQAASLPDEVRQFIVRRVEALPEVSQRVLEAASVVGVAFAAAAVVAGTQGAMEDVEAVCDGLVAQQHFLDDSGLTVWPDGTRGGSYRFQHALYQQALYERLGATRRMQLHRRIGARLEAGYGARAGDIAVQLAVHFERGGEVQRAVHALEQAGDNATRRHVYHEAVAALTKGLALLATLPESRARAQDELRLLLILGKLLIGMKGQGALAVGEVYTRAHTLCHQVGEPSQRFQALRGLFRFHISRAQMATAAALSQQLLHLAQHQDDPVLVLEGSMAVGSIALFRGDLVTARAHLEHSLRLCDPHMPLLPASEVLANRVISLALLTQALWALGYADQALQRGQEAVALAQQVRHPPSLAFAEIYATRLAQYRRDAAATQAYADTMMALGATHGLEHRVERGRLLRGWVLAMQGDVATGVVHIQQGLAAVQETGLNVYRPYWLSLLAEAYSQAEQPEAGLEILNEALVLVAETEERWWEAELYRLQGTLRLQLPSPDIPQVEACFQQALAVARSQQAKALELRAALHLSRLWQQQGKRTEAHQLLTDISGWFTEGFDTADLQDAKAFLEALRG
jgi:predicted ATPase/DNA-binding winged helix-turn-helix (wHTH) protein